MTSNDPRLPPEITSLIYDFLAANGDWQTLRTCGHLSHSQVSLTRKCLFATVSLRFSSRPHRSSIQEIVRRIRGLIRMLTRDPASRNYIKTFEVLDAFPVYESQWITQQPCLPRLLDLLPNVHCIKFGCEVGHVSWNHFSADLQQSVKKLLETPHLKTLTVSHLDDVPTSVFGFHVRYLYFKNVTTFPDDILDIDSSIATLPLPLIPPPRISYMEVRCSTIEHTESAWRVMKKCSSTLKYIKWRCWEDPTSRAHGSLPGRTAIDFSQLRELRKVAIRLSFGKVGNDLTGLHTILSSISSPSHLRILELSIHFPLQTMPHTNRQVMSHKVWDELGVILKLPEYASLEFVTLKLMVHNTNMNMNGRICNSVVEFRKEMKKEMRRLLNMSTLHFKLTVRAFNADAPSW